MKLCLKDFKACQSARVNKFINGDQQRFGMDEPRI